MTQPTPEELDPRHATIIKEGEAILYDEGNHHVPE